MFQAAELIQDGARSKETKPCSLVSHLPEENNLCVLFSHESYLISAQGKACSWNCSAASQGLSTAQILGLKGCEERSGCILGPPLLSLDLGDAAVEMG